MTILRKLARAFDIFLSAQRAAAAVEAHRPPAPADLRRLKIDARVYEGIHVA